MMSEAMERIIKGRVGVLSSEPFFGSLAMKLDLVEDPKAKSTWTDGKALAFNPEWAHASAMPQIEATIAHHVLSCAWGHHLRRGNRDRKMWQEASDYVVNLELQRAGFQLPQGSLIDSRFDKMTVEQVYRALDQKPEEGDGGGQGEGQDAGQGATGGDSGDANGQGKGQPQSDQKGSSGGAGDDATGTCEDATGDDGTPADEAERAEQEKDWQEATAQAAQIARGAGRLPGGIERGVEAFLNSKVDWREALQRLLKSKAKDDYSWLQPKRVGDVFLPSLRSDACGTLAFAIDVSGSIRQQQVDQFVSEIEEARQVMKPERIIALMFDTQVRKVWEFGREEPIEGIKAFAGGGTSFDDPVYELERLNVTPEVLAFLTDLDSRVFAPEPTYPVIWVSTSKDSAPYGDVIMMR